MMVCAAALFALTACGSGYNKDKAKELNDKIIDAQKDGKDLNDDEYAEVIDMVLAIVKENYALAADTIGNKEKKDALEKDKDFKNMVEYGAVLSYYIDSKEDKLSNDLTKKYKKAQKEADLLENAHQKKLIEKSTMYDYNRE